MAHLRHTPDRRLPECQAALFLWNGLTALRNIVDIARDDGRWGMAESHNFLSADGHSQQHPLPANRSDHQSNSPQLTTRASVRVVPWQVSDLKPHPTYAQLGIKIPASKLNELVELGEDAFAFPLFVTSTGIVIDGYARLEIARLQGRETIMCVEFDIPEEEALRRLILCHRRLAGLPAFCRIKLPNNLLPWMNSPLMDSSTTTRSGIIVTPPHAHAPFILQLHGLCGRIAVEKPITSDAWETRVLPPLALGTRPVLPMDHKLFTGVVCI